MQASDALPLPLGQRPEALSSDALPLPLQRGAEIVEAVARRYRAVGACFAVPTPAARSLQRSHSIASPASPASRNEALLTPPAPRQSRCFSLREAPQDALKNCFRVAFQNSARLRHVQNLINPNTSRLVRCARIAWPGSAKLRHQRLALLPAGQSLHYCALLWPAHGQRLRREIRTEALSFALHYCHGLDIPPSRLPPCEHYPRPEPPPPPPPPSPICGAEPASDALPLPLQFIFSASAAALPLPLRCAFGGHVFIIPQRSYLMHHTLNAHIDGRPIAPLSLQLQNQMDGFCWQLQLELPAVDFQPLRMDERAPGEEPILEVELNGQRWRFILEDYSDRRRHAAHGGRSYSLSGRSITARLGADYAATLQGIISGARYARQIAEEQLRLLPVRLGQWQAADWLIPANRYSISQKTPLAVLGDLAQAAGAYLESHPHLPQIDVKPRWPRPAWDLGQPQRVIPASAILSISGQKNIQAQARGVRIVPADGGTGAHVFRRGSDGLPALPDLKHALYTEQAAWMAAGIAALSDTGAHKMETVELPFSRRHGLDLAELGQIWQVEEGGAPWLGVVQGLSVDIQRRSDALSVRQNVVLNRYLGD